MDLFETTLKVLENRSVAQENLTLSKQDLEQYEDYISQLKEQIKELELNSSHNTQILEVNNFSKVEFNSHSVETKRVLGIIYGYVQEIEADLATMSQRESALSDLFDKSGDRVNNIDMNFANALKLIEIMKKDKIDKSLQKANEVQMEISAIDREIKDAEETLCCTMEQYERELKKLRLIKLELEVLEDTLETETQQQQLLIDENKKYARQHLEELNNDAEMNNKILEIEASILSVSQTLKEVLESKVEVLQKQIASQVMLEQLENESTKLEIKTREAENEKDRSIQKITQEIESMKSLIKQSESELTCSTSKRNEITKETEELNAKLNILSDELVTLQNNFVVEEKAFSKNIKLEEIAQEHEDLIRSSEKLVLLISENEEKIKQKQNELDLVKNASNSEIIELKLKIKDFDVEAHKKHALEKEIGDIDLRNKNLQQSVESHQVTIKDLTASRQKQEHERQENQKQLKIVLTNCDLVQKEIRRFETQKKERAKVFPKPQVKQTQSNKPKQQPKKRAFGMDAESDSSVDGERLSYAEFMAKKKMLKENKKQKRNTK